MEANRRAKSGRKSGIFVFLPVVVVLVCVSCSVAVGQPWDGNGVEGDPYQIWTAEDMQAIGADSNYWDAHFLLCADIDLSSTTYTTAIIAPDTNAMEVGFQGTKFTGVFDGNGHTISNFTCSFFDTVHNTFNVGIFGYVYGSGSIIKNLGLINPDISSTVRGVGSLVGQIDYGVVVNCYSYGGGVSGAEKVGGLVGGNYRGTISRCFSTTSVACTFIIGGFGGLAGANRDGLIVNSYARGNVSTTSADHVGGLVGTTNGGEIRNCYSTGRVSGDESVGGLVGINYTGDIYDSFWNKLTSGKSNMCGAEVMGDGCDDSYGKYSSAMKTASTFTDAGWDFVGEVINGANDIWQICEGEDYPRLWWEKYGGGSGTEANPYLIRTSCQMNAIGADSNDWNKHFKLMADIDLSAYTGTSFNIIGNDVNAFAGAFDGDGHTISNFSYSATGRNYTGLFGIVAEPNAEIKDLGLIRADVNAEGGRVVGSLVGLLSRGSILGCYSTNCSVCGEDYVGGLVGKNLFGSIHDCYATGTAEGNEEVGGLVGSNSRNVLNSYAKVIVSGRGGGANGGLVGFNNSDGYISECYATGSVIGISNAVGGLVGSNYGSIFNSYATGNAEGNMAVGGFIGSSWDGPITACYSTGTVDGNDFTGGLAGFHHNSSYTKCFWDRDVNPDVNGIGNTMDPNVIGESTANMQMEGTFTDAGWDFTTPVWTIDEGVDYPRLAWEPASLSVDLDMDEFWMYQSLPGQSNSDLTAGVSITDDPMGNTTYSYAWEILLPGDVTLAPVTMDGGGAGDAYWTFAARSCDEPAGLSDSGQTFKVKVTVTGDDYGNTGTAKAEFGIALLGDVNNSGSINATDRSIVNAFWKLPPGSVAYTLRDCDLNCSGAANSSDRSIVNGVWRGVFGQNSVTNPCPFR